MVDDGRGRFTRGTVAARVGGGSYKVLWVLLLLGWTVSAADRALTGPVVTWMIEQQRRLPGRCRQAATRSAA